MVDRFEKFSFAISEISRYWHKLAAEEMEKYGLKGPYAVYLTTMYRYKEGITAANLAEMCSRDKSDVSRAIALMEKNDLVVKISVNQNFYRAPLKLTDKGREIAEYIIEKAKAAVEIGGKGISEENREIFYNSLQTICSNLQELTQKGL